MSSVHGVCFDNGNAGRCDTDCSEFRNSNCDVSDEVLENAAQSAIDNLLIELKGEFWFIVYKRSGAQLNELDVIRKALKK